MPVTQVLGNVRLIVRLVLLRPEGCLTLEVLYRFIPFDISAALCHQMSRTWSVVLLPAAISRVSITSIGHGATVAHLLDKMDVVHWVILRALTVQLLIYERCWQLLSAIWRLVRVSYHDLLQHGSNGI